MLDQQMLAIIVWASDYPAEWHKIGKVAATMKAAELLASRGMIEIWRETNLYRIKPQS